MVHYEIKITRQAFKDIQKLDSKLKNKLKNILTELISEDPYSGKKLIGKLKDNYSYRLSIKDRIIYSVDEENKIIYLKRARTHYGE